MLTSTLTWRSLCGEWSLRSHIHLQIPLRQLKKSHPRQQFDLRFSHVLVKREIAAIEADDTAMFASDQPISNRRKRMKTQFLRTMTALATAFMLLIASSVTRVDAAVTYDLTSEQIETVLEEVFTKLAAFDAQGVVLASVGEPYRSGMALASIPAQRFLLDRGSGGPIAYMEVLSSYQGAGTASPLLTRSPRSR